MLYPYSLQHIYGSGDDTIDLCVKDNDPEGLSILTISSPVDKINILNKVIYGYGIIHDASDNIDKIYKYFVLDTKTGKTKLFQNEDKFRDYVKNLGFPFKFIESKKILADFYKAIAPDFKDVLNDMKNTGLILTKDRRIIGIKKNTPK